MAINYLRMRATATRLLTENGRTYQLTRGGSTTRDQFGKEVTTPVTTATVTGAITEPNPVKPADVLISYNIQLRA